MELRTGNIFDSDAHALVNAVNVVGVMGKGVAFGFRTRFPVMYEDYARRCMAGQVQMGQPYPFPVSTTRTVINFPTKRHWRENSRLEDMDTGLRYLANHLTEWGIRSMAVPALGCGEGGLSWAEVLPLMEKHLRRADIPIEVYRPVERRPLSNWEH